MGKGCPVGRGASKIETGEWRSCARVEFSLSLQQTAAPDLTGNSGGKGLLQSVLCLELCGREVDA
jgi:hypothetical protein